MRSCSFCGKRANEVARLIAGGGKQAGCELPDVAICDACVELSHAIVHGAIRASAPLLLWTCFVYDGAELEWCDVGEAQAGVGRTAIVRRLGTQLTVGIVFEPGEEPETVSVVRSLADNVALCTSLGLATPTRES